MNKLELIQTLCTTNGLSKGEATKAVNLFFDQMAAALEKGDRIEIRRLFSFYVRSMRDILDVIQKLGRRFLLRQKSYHILSVGRD